MNFSLEQGARSILEITLSSQSPINVTTSYDYSLARFLLKERVFIALSSTVQQKIGKKYSTKRQTKVLLCTW